MSTCSARSGVSAARTNDVDADERHERIVDEGAGLFRL
jgi:hypothetical protein